MGIGVKGFGGTSGGIEGTRLLPPAAVAVANIFQSSAISAVTFDGSTYLLRSDDYDGVVNSGQGLVSFWMKFNGSDGSIQQLIANVFNDIKIEKVANNKMSLFFASASNNFANYNFTTVNTFTSGPTWYHFLASWDTNFSSPNKLSHLYVNDVSDKTVTLEGQQFDDIDYNAFIVPNFGQKNSFGARANVVLNDAIDADVADVWYAPGQFLDFSDVNNRRKFISDSGKPVDLGANGETPTGLSPALFLTGDASSFATNLGTGGALALTGSLTNASTSPSDD